MIGVYSTFSQLRREHLGVLLLALAAASEPSMTTQDVVKCVSIASFGSSLGLIAVSRGQLCGLGIILQIMTYKWGFDRMDMVAQCDRTKQTSRNDGRQDGSGPNRSSPSRIDTIFRASTVNYARLEDERLTL